MRFRIARLTSVVCLLAACAAPTGAGAAPTAGTAATATGSLELIVGGNGKAARALMRHSVKARAIKPAVKRRARITFPVSSVAVDRSATVRLRGALVFKVGRRSVALRSLTARLTPGKATIAARVRKRRGVRVLSARYRRGDVRLNATGDAAALESARIGLTPRGARLLRKRLRLVRFPSGPLGVVSLDAVARGVGGGTDGGGTGGGGTGGGATPTCNPNPSAPPADPASEPAPLARPDGALSVASATIVWRPKESWIRYINGGEGTCVFDGATEGVREVRPGSTAPLVYSFGFPFANGWYHPGGTAALYFKGGVGFKWSSHRINFSTADPEIEINGSASRGIFRFNGADDTQYPNRRGVLVDLAPTADEDPSPTGYSFTMPATIPAGVGGSVFAGFYTAGTEFGSVTINFTTP